MNSGKGAGTLVPTGTSNVVITDLLHGDNGLAERCQGVSFTKALTISAQPAA